MGRRRVSKQGKENPLAGLELPGIERKRDILSGVPEYKVGAAAVRRTVRAFNPAPKEKRACYVCGRYQGISQAHHLIEIGKVAKVLRAMAIYDWAPSIPSVSLCPNHHAYEHLMRRAKKPLSPEISRALDELSDFEWDRLIELDELRDEAHDRRWLEVRREFLKRESTSQQASNAG
jgi:hypothetical protein